MTPRAPIAGAGDRMQVLVDKGHPAQPHRAVDRVTMAPYRTG